MLTEHITNYENKDFTKFIEIQILIEGIYFLEKDEDKTYKMNLKYDDFELFQDSTMDILKVKIEEKIKKYIINKIKENCKNTVELARKYDLPVKNILYCYFINNRIDNIEIIWSSSSIKEFKYVPVKHYLDYDDDSVLLKVKGIKLKKKL
jgi:hypothetical protein